MISPTGSISPSPLWTSSCWCSHTCRCFCGGRGCRCGSSSSTPRCRLLWGRWFPRCGYRTRRGGWWRNLPGWISLRMLSCHIQRRRWLSALSASRTWSCWLSSIPQSAPVSCSLLSTTKLQICWCRRHRSPPAVRPSSYRSSSTRRCDWCGWAWGCWLSYRTCAVRSWSSVRECRSYWCKSISFRTHWRFAGRTIGCVSWASSTCWGGAAWCPEQIRWSWGYCSWRWAGRGGREGPSWLGRSRQSPRYAWVCSWCSRGCCGRYPWISPWWQAGILRCSSQTAMTFSTISCSGALCTHSLPARWSPALISLSCALSADRST